MGLKRKLGMVKSEVLERTEPVGCIEGVKNIFASLWDLVSVFKELIAAEISFLYLIFEALSSEINLVRIIGTIGGLVIGGNFLFLFSQAHFQHRIRSKLNDKLMTETHIICDFENLTDQEKKYQISIVVLTLIFFTGIAVGIQIENLNWSGVYSAFTRVMFIFSLSTTIYGYLDFESSLISVQKFMEDETNRDLITSGSIVYVSESAVWTEFYRAEKEALGTEQKLKNGQKLNIVVDNMKIPPEKHFSYYQILKLCKHFENVIEGGRVVFTKTTEMTNAEAAVFLKNQAIQKGKSLVTKASKTAADTGKNAVSVSITKGKATMESTTYKIKKFGRHKS